MLLHDLSYGARTLGRQPGFTLAAGLSLALGIGATTAIFTVLNAVALRPLPYADADRLLWMTQILKKNSTDEVTITLGAQPAKDTDEIMRLLAGLPAVAAVSKAA